MKKIVITTAILLSFVVPAIRSDAAEPSLFPEASLSQGWETVKESRFTGASLYSHIDGGAELFFEFGFSYVDVRIVKPINLLDEITIEIYQMADPDAALGIFLLKHANLEPDTRLPVPNFLNNYQAVFAKGECYVLLSSASGSESFKDIMVKFAAETASKIAGKPTNDFSRLPKTNIIPGSERLLRGSLALQALYPLGEGSLFWQDIKEGEFLNAFAADYKMPTGAIYTYIVCDFPDEASATKGLDSVRNGHDPYLTLYKSTTNELILKDWDEQFVIIRVQGKALEIFTRLKKPEIPNQTTPR